MRIRSLDPLQCLGHPTEARAALRLMELCWQRDVIEQQLQARTLGADAREPLEDVLSTINNQLRLIGKQTRHLGSKSMHRPRLKGFSSGVRQSLLCRICGKPVSLETAKTDKFGKAVHEDCYVFKLRLERASQDAKAA